MHYLHRFVLRLKHWQAFFMILIATLAVGYPLYLLGQRTLAWRMSFLDSPAPGISLYLFWAIWLDALLTAGQQNLARIISPILMLALLTGSICFQNSPYGMLLFLPAIIFVGWVMVPASKAMHVIERRKAVLLEIILDTVIVACFFPIGLWILQPRLNAALAGRSNTAS